MTIVVEKKNLGRFTIQFNLGDPRQLSVAELLERQGRHKAQFIAAAVLHYANCPEMPEITPSQALDRTLLEKLVREILEQQSGKTEALTADPQEENAPTAEQAAEMSNEPEKLFGKDGLAAITSTLSAFQIE